MAKKVLIVDDDPELLELVECIVRSQGYDVETSDNGRSALEIILKNKPDLVILDVMLPGLDGHALAMRLSTDSETANIPLVVVTALEQSRSLFANISTVKAFFTKPFRASDFTARLREITG